MQGEPPFCSELLDEQEREQIDAVQARALSIQSHVVSGYVGNKSALFPLQLLGIETDAINTCQFSNHTGYPSWEGERLSGEQLRKLFEGMERNGLACHTHVLSGYAGRADLIESLVWLVQAAISRNPGTVYLCDPVMGDNGKLYVAQEVVSLYINSLLPLANIITPNHFEAELLAEMKITSEKEAIDAMDKLHEKGPRAVVITSSELYGIPDELVLLASERRSNSGTPHRFRIRIPAIPGYFTGTGDLFAALLLAWHSKHPSDFQLACEKAVCATHSVLKETVRYYNQHGLPKEGMYPELKIISSKSALECPLLLLRAEKIE